MKNISKITPEDVANMSAAEQEELQAACLTKIARRNPTFLKLNGNTAMNKIASTGKTPKVTVDDVLAAQIPSLRQTPLDAAIAGDRRQVNMVDLSEETGMEARTARELEEIIAGGLETLPPGSPSPSDYSRFHDAQAARSEQMRRAQPSGSAAKPFWMSPSTQA